MQRAGGIVLGVGLGVLAGWGLYHLFWVDFSSFPLPVKIASTAIAAGLIILLASLVWERHRVSKEEKAKFKGVEK